MGPRADRHRDKADGFCNILSNCCVAAVQDGPFDSGAFTADPQFTDAAHGDYTLKRNSPCREKGLRLDWMTDDTLDITGLPDIGCYAYRGFVGGIIMTFR